MGGRRFGDAAVPIKIWSPTGELAAGTCGSGHNSGIRVSPTSPWKQQGGRCVGSSELFMCSPGVVIPRDVQQLYPFGAMYTFVDSRHDRKRMFALEWDRVALQD
ncbi:unnamed protein product, partial [Pylaiella littoralis]